MRYREAISSFLGKYGGLLRKLLFLMLLSGANPPKKPKKVETWGVKISPKTPQETQKSGNLGGESKPQNPPSRPKKRKLGGEKRAQEPPKKSKKMKTWWVFEQKKAPQEVLKNRNLGGLAFSY